MIFCVEDEQNICELEVYTLQSVGMEAQGCGSGRELFALLEKQVPELIVLDIMLPDEDGVSILRRLRADKRYANIPVIMATAKGSEFDKVKGLDSGADDYIAKAANSGYEANFRHKRNKLAAKRHALRKSIFRFFKAYNFIIGAFCRCSPDGIDGNNKKNCCNKQSAPSFQGCHSFLSNKLSGHQREQSHRFRHRKNVINKRGFFAYIPY